jgi:hypothetical protein
VGRHGGPVSWSRRNGPRVVFLPTVSHLPGVPVSRLPQRRDRVPSGAGYSHKTMPSQGRAGKGGVERGRACRSEAESLDWHSTLPMPAREAIKATKTVYGVNMFTPYSRSDGRRSSDKSLRWKSHFADSISLSQGLSCLELPYPLNLLPIPLSAIARLQLSTIVFGALEKPGACPRRSTEISCCLPCLLSVLLST